MLRFFSFMAAAIVLLDACGGSNGNGIECVQDSNCDLMPGGQCIQAPSGRKWCAYMDSSCPSGMRFTDIDVGDGLAGMCVAPADAGVPDAMEPDTAITDAGIPCTTSVDCSAGEYCHFSSCTTCADLSVIGFNQPENLSAVNTAENDFNISLSGDGTRLFVLHVDGFKEYDIDAQGNLSAGVSLAIPSTPGSISRLHVATSDRVKYFLSERVDIGGSINPEVSIWRSEWNGASFSTPVQVTELNQADANSGFAGVTADGLTIYFSSNRPEIGDPTQDDNIWISARNGATWSTPTKLGSLSTNMEEAAPSINGDSLIYTSSVTGFNQTLQISTPIGSAPVPLSDVNQAGADTSFGVLTPDRCTLYFVSNRSGGQGGFDVWRATRR